MPDMDSTIISKQHCLEVIGTLPIMFLHQFYKIACYYNGLVNQVDLPSMEDRNLYINETFMASAMLGRLLAVSSNGKPVEGQINVDYGKSKLTLAAAFEFFKKGTAKPFNIDEADVVNIDDVNAEQQVKNVEVQQPLKQLPVAPTKNTDGLEMMDVDEALGGLGAEQPKTQAAPEPNVSGKTARERIKERVAAKKKPRKTEEKPLSDPSQKLIGDVVNQVENLGLDDKTAADIFEDELGNWGVKKGTLGYKALMYLAENYVFKGQKNKSIDTMLDMLSKQFNLPRVTVISSLSNIAKKGKFENGVYTPELKNVKNNNGEITWRDILNQLSDYLETE